MEAPKTVSRTANKHSKECSRPGTRPTHHESPFGTLPIGSLVCARMRFPESLPIHFAVKKQLIHPDPYFDRELSHGTQTQGLRCRGLGKSVQGRVAFRGQSAAHGQITERRLSVTRSDLSSPIASLSAFSSWIVDRGSWFVVSSKTCFRKSDSISITAHRITETVRLWDFFV